MTDRDQTEAFADIVARLTSLTLSGELVWSTEHRDSISYPFLMSSRNGWTYELKPEWSSPRDTIAAALRKQPLQYSLEARHEGNGDTLNLPPMLALGVLAKAAQRSTAEVAGRLLRDLG